jgi:hypothetical protein
MTYLTFKEEIADLFCFLVMGWILHLAAFFYYKTLWNLRMRRIEYLDRCCKSTAEIPLITASVGAQ